MTANNTNRLTNPEEITKWVLAHAANAAANTQVTVLPNGEVNVTGNIHIALGDETELPVQFHTVAGEFILSGAKLKTLAGSPHQCDSFRGHGLSSITTLRGGPIVCSGKYWITFADKLMSFEGAPATCQTFQIERCPVRLWDYCPAALNLVFNKMLPPSPDEMRKLITNTRTLTIHDYIENREWYDHLKTFYQDRDLLKMANAFEELYGEPLLTPASPTAVPSELTLDVK